MARIWTDPIQLSLGSRIRSEAASTSLNPRVSKSEKFRDVGGAAGKVKMQTLPCGCGWRAATMPW